jgi:hypothetical protein
MIVEKQMECRLAGETEVLGEDLPQRQFCPSQNLIQRYHYTSLLGQVSGSCKDEDIFVSVTLGHERVKDMSVSLAH